jgi:hypothetical protein
MNGKTVGADKKECSSVLIDVDEGGRVTRRNSRVVRLRKETFSVDSSFFMVSAELRRYSLT